MVVQVVPSGEAWIWNDFAYAASQFRVTSQIVWLVPRSTWTHCGSENALDQRVPVLPSNALDAGKVAFSSEDAVAGFPWDSRVAAWALPALLAMNMMASARAAISAPNTRLR